MRTDLLELCRLKPRRHMVAHQTPEVALGFERVEERLAPILGGRDLHQTDERGLAPVASHADGDLRTGEELLYQDRTRVVVAHPAAALGCGDSVGAQRFAS